MAINHKILANIQKKWLELCSKQYAKKTWWSSSYIWTTTYTIYTWSVD